MRASANNTFTLPSAPNLMNHSLAALLLPYCSAALLSCCSPAVLLLSCCPAALLLHCCQKNLSFEGPSQETTPVHKYIAKFAPKASQADFPKFEAKLLSNFNLKLAKAPRLMNFLFFFWALSLPVSLRIAWEVLWLGLQLDNFFFCVSFPRPSFPSPSPSDFL